MLVTPRNQPLLLPRQSAYTHNGRQQHDVHDAPGPWVDTGEAPDARLRAFHVGRQCILQRHGRRSGKGLSRTRRTSQHSQSLPAHTELQLDSPLAPATQVAAPQLRGRRRPSWTRIFRACRGGHAVGVSRWVRLWFWLAQGKVPPRFLDPDEGHRAPPEPPKLGAGEELGIQCAAAPTLEILVRAVSLD